MPSGVNRAILDSLFSGELHSNNKNRSAVIVIITALF